MNSERAIFTRGSTLGHILKMTAANTMGLLALFSADLVDMYFLSLLGQHELAAAIGFAATLLFYLTSINIGLLISMGVLVSRAEGADNRLLVQQSCTNVSLFTLMISIAVTIPVWLFVEPLLGLMGASGLTLQYAVEYCQILLLSTPILASGMVASSALRAVGDAKHSMWATVISALVNVVFDPIFIFGLDMGIRGAAVASVLSRITLFAICYISLVKVHSLFAKIDFARLKSDIRSILKVAVPAMMTNLATPIGSTYVLITMATFGDDAVAGAAIVGRIAPVAFAAVFALSGAIGPIIGQNAGAGQYGRVRDTLMNSILVTASYVMLVWLVLFLGREWIVTAFNATGMAAELIRFYCHWLVGGFVFIGTLFISNATFNNLNQPTTATVFNFCRALLGTIPLVYICSYYYGAAGVLAGELLGGLFWGVLALTVALWRLNKLDREHTKLHLEESEHPEPWVYSSQRSQLGQSSVQKDSE